MQSLFRQQAIEHQQQRLYGEVLVLPRISHSLLTACLVAWVGLVLIWLFNSHYARKETVIGWLEPPQGLVRVYAPAQGLVQTLLVKDGDSVTQGQTLLIIEDERSLANGQSLDAQLLQEYQTQSRLLDEQISRTQTSYDQRQQALQQRIQSAKTDLQVIQQQQHLQQLRLDFATTQLTRLKGLQAAGHAATQEVENANTQQLSLQNEQQNLARSQVAQTTLLQQLASELALLPSEKANTLDQLRSRLSDITQQTSQLNGRRQYSLKAPNAGIVNNLQVTLGQHIGNANIPLLSLLPANSTLNVQLLVPVRAAGFIEPGQPLAIRYDAFPYQKFGLYSGTITQVSNTLLLPNELLNAPTPINQAVYRVTAQLTQPSVNAYGKTFPLKPGMTLSADISLGDRTLIQWLLEPILSLKGHLQ